MSGFELEPERSFAAPDGTVWIRSGSCSRCGECCAGEWSPLGLERPREVAGMCGAYTADAGDGCGGCVLHELAAKPVICDTWPSHPSQIGADTTKPSCTYTFRKA